MVKGFPKWFYLLVCAVMMFSSSAEAQRKTKKNAQKKEATAVVQQNKNASEETKKAEGQQDEDKGGSKEVEIEELTEEQLDVDEPVTAGAVTSKVPAGEKKKEEKKEDKKAEQKKAEAKDEAKEKEREPEKEVKEEEKDSLEKEDIKEDEEVVKPEEEPEEEVVEVVQEEEGQSEEPVQEEETEEVIAEEPVSQEAVEEIPPEEEPQPELGPDEIMGIDTVDLEDPQGNWLYKRVWWERAEAKYEKIRAAVTSVLEIRTKFFAKRAELDKNTLDPFYVTIGFSQAELKERLSDRIAQLEKSIEDKSDVELLERLESEKQALDDLQKEVALVLKLDSEIDNAIMMLVEQSNKMRNYEQQAWQDFKDIARVLDDKKARELFYKVDGAWRNIQELKQYVESNFATGFDQLVERLVKQVQKVGAVMQQLKEKGVSLMPAEPERDEKEEEEEPKQGVISRFIITPIKTVLRGIWDVIMWPIRKIFGMGKPTEPSSAKASVSAKVSPDTSADRNVVEEVAIEEVVEKQPVADKPATIEPAAEAAEERMSQEPIPFPSVEIFQEEAKEPEMAEAQSEMPMQETEKVTIAEEPMAGGEQEESVASGAQQEESEGQAVVGPDEREPMMDQLDTTAEIEEE